MLKAENIDMEHMLESLDVRNISRASTKEWNFSCPMPGHPGMDNSPSCYMNAFTGAWFCHSCHSKGGNVSSFVSEALGISIIEASRLLRERYQPGGINPDQRNIKHEIESIINENKEKAYNPPLPEEITKRFAVEWQEAYNAYKAGQGFPPLDYMFDRGFTPLALTEWEFGYDKISDRPVFAVRNEDGELIGYKGRAWHDKQLPRYLNIGDKPDKHKGYDFPCYQKSLVLYGANRVYKGSSVVLCEGELNAVAVQQKTGMHAVAINGSFISKEQVKILKSIANEVFIFADSDPAGDDVTKEIVKSLHPFTKVWVVQEHEGDPAEMDGEQIEKLVTNSTEDINYLLEIGGYTSG